MDDISLFLKALSKDEMIELAKHFNVVVNGFQRRNIGKAHLRQVSNALEQEFKASLTSRKRNRYTSLKKAHNYLSTELIKDHPELKNASLNEIGIRAGMDLKGSKGTIVSYLYTDFPEVYEEKKEELYENLKSGSFILKGIIQEMSSEDKMNVLNSDLHIAEGTRIRLEQYMEKTIEEKGEDYFADLRYRVNREDRDSFVKIMSTTPDEEKYLPALAFLIENDRHVANEFQPLLQLVTNQFDNILHSSNEQLMSDISSGKELYRQKSIESERFKEKLNSSIAAHQRLKTSYEEISQKYFVLQNENENIKRENKKINSFTSYFYNLVEHLNLCIITNNPVVFEGTPLDRQISSFHEFSENMRRKNSTPYMGKTVLLTRVSFKTTRKWMNAKWFLENSQISFGELSGYKFEEYIKQIVEFAHKGEHELHDGIYNAKQIKS